MSDKLYYHPVYTDYACTIDGRVWSNKKYHGTTGRWLKIKGNDYKGINIYLECKKTLYVHRFVYECVTGKLLTLSVKSGDGLVIDHIDGNKQNNAFANLQVITNRRNTQKWSCKNYYFDKNSGKWKVNYRVGKKLIHDSLHKTEKQAISRVEQLREQGIIW